MVVMKNRRKISTPIDSLLDKDMDQLPGDEAAFYTDQKGPRIGRISEDVDLKYVKEKEDELAELEAAH